MWEGCYPIAQIATRAHSDPKLQNWLDHREHRKEKKKTDTPIQMA